MEADRRHILTTTAPKDWTPAASLNDVKTKQPPPPHKKKNKLSTEALLILGWCFFFFFFLSPFQSHAEKWSSGLLTTAICCFPQKNQRHKRIYAKNKKKNRNLQCKNVCLTYRCKKKKKCAIARQQTDSKLVLFASLRTGWLPAAVHQDVREGESRGGPAAPYHPPGTGGLGSVQDRPSGAHTGGGGLAMCAGESKLPTRPLPHFFFASVWKKQFQFLFLDKPRHVIGCMKSESCQ